VTEKVLIGQAANGTRMVLKFEANWEQGLTLVDADIHR
jgi:hypothetical protein